VEGKAGDSDRQAGGVRSAAIGALSLTFSPTFWFNAEEAEVYGMSMLFVGMITYLSLRWNDRADEPGNEKYICSFRISSACRSASICSPSSQSFVHDDLLLSKIRIYAYLFLKFGAAAIVIFGIVYPRHREVVPRLLDGSVTIAGEEIQKLRHRFDAVCDHRSCTLWSLLLRMFTKMY